MKSFYRFLIATLVTALFFSSLTHRVWALDNATEAKPADVLSEVQAAIDPSKDVPIQEVMEKREANVKHFLTDNFRYVAMVYPVVVHYKENGSWKEIDNHLQNAVDENKNEVVENVANDVKVRLAKNTQSGKLVSIKLGNYGLSWSFEGIAKKAVQVIQPSDVKDKDITTVENLNSSVKYLDTFPGVDLEYILRGEEVKENLILKSRESQRSFTQTYSFTNLTPKSQDDGTILLVDDKGVTVFRFERPLLVDAKGEESQDIQSTLTQFNNTWQLTLTPSANWLDAPERVYPITLDPTVTTPISVAAIDDAHVTASLPTSNFYNSYILKTGYGGAIHRTYLKFALPTLTSSDMVIASTLAMSLANVASNSQNDYQVNAHKVIGTWTETGLTWNNKPAYNSKIEDYEVVGHSAVGQDYTWNITSIVKEWYSTGVNNGLMLKDNVETSGYKEYYSADTSQAYLAYRPVISIAYVNNNGLESYWTYHSQNVGRAGTGYTNDYNGNLVFIRQDTVGTGNRMPVSVSHVYNLNDRETNTNFGNGWRLNYAQQAGSKVIGTTTYYYWIDEDGTKHYFAYDSAKSKYMDEAGTQLWMVKNTNNTFTMTDAQNNISQFNTAGQLTEIQNSDGQKITLTYNASSQLIEIKDDSNRSTTLTYGTGNCGTGINCLASITSVDGRVTNFTYSGLQLTGVTEVIDTDPANNKVSTYTYDGTGVDQYKLLTITNFDGYKMTYSYSTLEPYRVIKFIESNGATLGEELNLSYGYNTTFFTDTNSRKEIYTFNNSGNTVTIQDPDGYAQYYSYNESGSVKNSMAVESKLQKTVVNLLTNHSYETDASWTIGYDGTSTASIGYATTSKYMGNRTFYINKTNTANRHYFSQSVTGITKGQTYTFSGYIKTVGISAGTNVGAALGVYVQNAAGTWIETKSKSITGTQDWQRVEVTFTVPTDSAITSFLVRPMIEGATGAAYFDALQLEEGKIANRYNIVENGNMDKSTDWSFGGGTDANDKILTLTTNLPPTSLNNDVLQINGAFNQNKQAVQYINATGVAGDSFVVSGWTKAGSAPMGRSARVALYFRFDNTDLSYTYRSKDFNTDSNEWQFLSYKALADKPYTRVVVILLYAYNVNTAYFDGISAFKEEFGQSYVYDANGNVTSVVDLAKQTSSFAYTNNNLTLATDAKSSQFTYTYDTTHIHRIIGASSAESVKYSFAYDTYGNATSATIGDGSGGTRKITTSTAYTSDGNYVTSKTDALGNIVTYNINTQNGLVNSVTDPLNHTVTNAYNSDYSLNSVSTTVGGQTVANNYTYENDRLKTITHNGFAYTFVYDTFGNVTEVKVGTTTLITNAYQARTGRLNSFTYGNGDTIEYVFDSFDRITGVKIGGVLTTTYDYDANGVVGRVTDVSTGKSTRYIYDFANRLVRVEDSNGNSVAFGYDANNNASTFIDTINGTTYTTSYTYDKDNRPTLVTSPNSSTTGYTYDVLGRLTSKKWKVGTMEYSTTYTYKDKDGSTTQTSTQLTSIQNGGDSTKAITYEYDANGNITTITENALEIQYIYNELNEVIRENNQRDNKTLVYNYDLGGNLLSKVEYAYTTGTLGDPVQDGTITYAYGNTNWKDLLTSFDGNAITYDAIGNPLTYDGGTFSWEGRKLISFNKTGLAVTYKYNENGIRTSKDVNGSITTYRLSGDKVTFEQTKDSQDVVLNQMYYVYDNQGQLISMILNGTEYAYIRNAQNDVVGLVNNLGVQVVKYKYSTWGEVTIVDDTSTVNLGTKNPYLYRGYRYDSETGLYYLQSRYYNPQWGRFLNSDEIMMESYGMNAQNNFAFCGNNPINNIDENGKVLGSIAAFFIGGIIGAGISTVMQLIDISINKKPISSFSLVDAVGSFVSGGIAATGWGLLRQVITNAAIGGLQDVAQQLLDNPKKGINFASVAISTITGAFVGFVGGKGAGLKKASEEIAEHSLRSSFSPISKVLLESSKSKFKRSAVMAISKYAIGTLLGNLVKKEIARKWRDYLE